MVDNPWIHHFPHYVESFFPYFSLVLWQDRLFGKRVVGTLGLNLSHSAESGDRLVAWKYHIQGKPTWINAITSAFEKKMSASTSVVLPKGNWNCFLRTSDWLHSPKANTWFLHPLDAFILASLVTDTLPCDSLPSAAANISVLIVDRKNDRRILNRDDVHRKITDTIGPQRIGSVNFAFLEGAPFSEQIRMVRESQILLAPHGAAVTNAAFLKPCSIVIEIYPAMYFWPTFYGSLANQSYLLHYFFEATLNETSFENYNKKDDYRCRDVLQTARRGIIYNGSSDHVITKRQSIQASHNITDLFAYERELVAGDSCFASHLCRLCARSIAGLTINLDKLGEAIQDGMRQREKCLRALPLQASSSGTSTNSSVSISINSSDISANSSISNSNTTNTTSSINSRSGNSSSFS
jgi:hypothetical protein